MKFPTNTLAIANLYALLSAINAAIAPIVISLGGLAGAYLLADDKSLSTLPVSGFNVGIALMAGPASLLMFKIGRRRGFMAGAILGFVGVSVAGAAILLHSCIWFCAGLILTGCANSFVQQYRFAASDFVDDTLKSQAISRVLVGGIASAVIGPQIVLHNKDLLYPTPFAGAFLSGACLFIIGLLIMTLLPEQAPKKREVTRIDGRTKKDFARDPTFITAVFCGTSSYALMAFVMTAAPLAMVGCGYEVADAALGIQWHVLAMFDASVRLGKRSTCSCYVFVFFRLVALRLDKAQDVWAKKCLNVPPGNLQMKRPRPPKSAPGGFKIELRGIEHDLLEASGRLLGARLAHSWRLLRRSWGALDASWGRLRP